ncbi:MAG: hypothetical protein FWH33_09215 [Oscillospiraceae bacterium]|nr:hypothetical protein [Oscillospiraceae bacterium]
MRVQLSLKTLLRTPLKTLLTFVLLAATSYMIFFGMAEYVVTRREFDRVAGQYRGVGAVESKPLLDFDIRTLALNQSSENRASKAILDTLASDFYLYLDERVASNPYDELLLHAENGVDSYRYAGISQADIEYLSGLPYVTSASTRYMTAGVAEDLERTDLRSGYYDYTARFIAEITIEMKGSGSVYDYSPGAALSSILGSHVSGEYTERKIVVNDMNFLAGNKEALKWYMNSMYNVGEFSAILNIYDFPLNLQTRLPANRRRLSGNEKRGQF